LIRALFDGLFCFDDTDTPEYNCGPPGAVEPTPGATSTHSQTIEIAF